MEAGAAHVEEALGRTMIPGGRHARMGTWNRVLGLGDCYLEAIAVEPGAAAPDRARWYGLDDREGPPALDHWALRVDDLDAACDAWPGAGDPLRFERDGLRWRMAVPPDGRLPFDAVAPALIEWETRPPRIANGGVTLSRLVLRHPDAHRLAPLIAGLSDDSRLLVEAGAASLAARIETPDGLRTLR